MAGLDKKCRILALEWACTLDIRGKRTVSMPNGKGALDEKVFRFPAKCLISSGSALAT
jgi:hypothetical protein